MTIAGILMFGLLGAAAATVLGAVLYLVCSPMFVVKLLRRGGDGELSYPDHYEAARDKVKIERDVRYHSAYGKNELDFYLPQNQKKCPLVLWIHGGAFVAGDKAGVENWGVMLASEGYATAVMNYEWAPEASYPAQVIQVCEAFREIIRLSETYAIDLSRIAIAGDSAGAHIASQFVLVHTNREMQKLLGIKSPLEYDSLKCALLYCGPYDLQSMLENPNRILKFFISRIGWCYLGKRNWKSSPYIDAITPMNYADENFVPCYITDGNKGSFESHAKALGRTLKAHQVEVKERYFPPEAGEVMHEYQMLLADDRAKICFRDTVEFLGRCM